jgi:hypothetical protein
MLAVEVLVLLLIAHEVGSGIWHRVRRNRRSRRAHEFFSHGQTLQNGAPGDPALVTDWLRQVEKWINDTNELLTRYSSQASASFLHDSGRAGMHYGGVAQDAQRGFAALQERLNNLRAIMGRPDVCISRPTVYRKAGR